MNKNSFINLIIYLNIQILKFLIDIQKISKSFHEINITIPNLKVYLVLKYRKVLKYVEPHEKIITNCI